MQCLPLKTPSQCIKSSLEGTRSAKISSQLNNATSASSKHSIFTLWKWPSPNSGIIKNGGSFHSYSAYSSSHSQKNNCNSATSHKKIITEVRVTMYYICGHVPIILSIFRQMFETSKEFYLLMPCDIIM